MLHLLLTSKIVFLKLFKIYLNCSALKMYSYVPFIHSYKRFLRLGWRVHVTAFFFQNHWVFEHCPPLSIRKNTTYWKPDLFPSSDKVEKKTVFSSF
jgi:hypothetical protein